MEEEKEMSFIDHLEALRWHIIRSVASIVVFFIAAFSSKSFIFHDVILGPSRTDFFTYRMLCRLGEYLNSPALCINELPFTLQSREMTGQFTTHLSASFLIAFIFAFPYTFWELWRFVKPGLYPTERKSASGAVFFVSLLFILGAMFGYYVVSPLSINFLAGYQVDPSIVNEFDISSYISTLSMLVIACAVMFELPVAVYFLTKAGLVSAEIMKVYRKHAVIVILLISAIITPPDVMSQVLIALPIFLLYEISILLSKMVRRREIQRLNER